MQNCNSRTEVLAEPVDIAINDCRLHTFYDDKQMTDGHAVYVMLPIFSKLFQMSSLESSA